MILTSSILRLVGAVIALGIICGLGGAGYTLLLNGVEYIAFGFTTGTVAEAATETTILRRFLVVVSAGCLAAATWWALRKFGRHVPSVSETIGGADPPPGWTITDTAVQVMNVGAGASIGREGAPRQFGAMVACVVSRWLDLPPRQKIALMACGAGAGLASIYNVPLGGACFALECVWGFRRLRESTSRSLLFVAIALITSYLATLSARVIVPDRPIYSVPSGEIDLSLLLFAAICGPIFGAVGFLFGKFFDKLSHNAIELNSILWVMPISYLALAALAVPFPLVLGNGHALSLSVFNQELPLSMAAMLLLAKPLATFITVGSGATGGKLTPSLSTGAVLGLTLSALWSTIWPVSAVNASVVGAAAVLGAAINAPITALVLLVEFTGFGAPACPSIAVAILVATMTTRWFGRFETNNLSCCKR
jgi:H+/Cl- antiporter ClcA